MNENLTLEEKKDLLKNLLAQKNKHTIAGNHLSYGQESLWFLYKANPGNSNYNSGFSIKINGNLNVPVFKSCMEDIQHRHSILRTVYKETPDGPQQEIIDNVALYFEIIDISELSPDETYQMIINKNKEIFDLEKGPVHKSYLFKKSETEHIFLFSIHHIAFDEWSSRIMLDELNYLYNHHLRNNFKPEMHGLPFQYKSFVAHQRQLFQTSNHQNFWKAYLENHDEMMINLKGDNEILFKKAPAKSAGIKTLCLKPELVNQVRQMSVSNNITAYQILLSVFQVLLYKYTCKSKFIIGTPVAGRNNPSFANTIGYFVNLLPLKCTLSSTMNLWEFIRGNSKLITEALSHQDYPFKRMVEDCCSARDLDNHSFFNITYSYLNQKTLKNELSKIATVDDSLNFQIYDIPYQQEAFDLTLEIKDLDERIILQAKYKTDKYSDDFISVLLNNFEALLNEINSSDSLLIRDLKLTGDIEKHNYSEPPSLQTNINNILREQISKYENHYALCYKDEKLTYKEFSSAINHLSHGIFKQIVGKKRVGLTTERSFSMIQGIYSIINCGGSYVPLPPDLPEERYRYIINDAEINLILTDKHNYSKARGYAPDNCVLCIEELLSNPAADEGFMLHYKTNAEAYVIYTSGSTGIPKGVPIKQSSVINLVKDTNYVRINPTDQILQLSNFAFDGSIFDIFGALLNGATLHLIPYETLLSGYKLIEYIKEHRITVSVFTTALFNELVDLDPDFLINYDKILIGGEALSVKHIQIALNHVKNKNVIINGYGPTECTTFSTYFNIDHLDVNAKSIPIGKAVKGAYIYLLNDNKEIVPPYVVGEIYIGGIGLTDGYVNQKNGSEKFIPDPFNPSKKIYASGDFGMILSNNELAFLGRKDHQVKLRGHRIELGEIESCLYKLGFINKASVFCVEKNTTKAQLIACIEPENNSITESSVKDGLATFLPSYMMPSRFIFFEKIPLNSNGKIDRKILFSHIQTQGNEKKEKIMPKTDLEKKIVSLWSEILPAKDIGINDNFFELGGHSLLAMRIIARIKNEFNVEVEVRELFNSPTIGYLCNYIAKKQSEPPFSVNSTITKRSREQYLLKK